MIERMEAEQRRQARQAQWTIGISILTILAVIGLGLLNYFG